MNKSPRYSAPKKIFWLCAFLLGYHLLATKVGISVSYGDFPLTRIWKTSFGERVAQLTISPDGSVIVRTAYTLASLDARSGALLWKMPMRSGFSPRAAIIDGTDVFVANDKVMYAINIKNGQVLWQSAVANRNNSEAIVQAASSCCVLISTLKQKLIAYNRNTGKEMVILASGGNDWASASVENDLIYVISRGAMIVNGATLNIIWKQDWSATGYGAFFHNGIAYFADGSQIAALDFHTRRVIWKRPQIGGTGTLWGTSKYLLMDGIEALDTASGDRLWKIQMEGTKGTIMDGRIYFLNPVWKQMHVLNLGDGKVLGTIQLGLPDIMQLNYVSEAIGVYDDFLLVGVNESVYGFSKP